MNLPYLQMGNKLKPENSHITTIMEFVLLDFSDIPNLQWILFGIFSVIYLTILMCNSVIILITRIDSTLHIPMYFFLNNFSFLEICYVTFTIPRMLMDILIQKGHICFTACAIPMCFFLCSEAQSVFFWQWWPMMAMWPFVTLSTMSSHEPQALCPAGHHLLAQWSSFHNWENVADSTSALLWVQHS